MTNIPDRAQKLNAAGIAAIPAPGTVVPLPPPSSSGRKPVVEYAIEADFGTMHVRSNDPEEDRIYPLDRWIPDNQQGGGKVFRRTVIVVEDWEEAPRG